MTSQRKISKVQAFEIKIVDDSRIRPKAAMSWLVAKLEDE
jgi:hypothetical protein